MRGEPVAIKGEYKETVSTSTKMSRYKNLKRLVNEDNVPYIESPVKTVIKESTRDVFYSVEPGYENRLDLISHRFYNTPFLWWAIAQMNNIDNPMIIKAGIVLRIPNISSIYGAGGILAADKEDS